MIVRQVILIAGWSVESFASERAERRTLVREPCAERTRDTLHSPKPIVHLMWSDTHPLVRRWRSPPPPPEVRYLTPC